MTFKKIWNALKTDDLREELWNELTDEQKMSIMNDHPQPQIDRLYDKLSPVLTDQANKYYAEIIRLNKLYKKIKMEGKLGIPKYLNSNIENPEIKKLQMDELFNAWNEIFDFYFTSWGYMLIFQKSIDLKPQKIMDLELDHFWKHNVNLEKQKKDWDIRFGKLIRLKTTEQHYSTGERFTEPYPATENDITMEFRDRFLFGFDENEQEHNS
jgi:hypothetical protein